jgi:hypothetical protein
MRTRSLVAAALAFAFAAPAAAQVPPESPTGRGIGGSASGIPDRRIERRAEPAKPSDIAPPANAPAANGTARRNDSATPGTRSNGVAAGGKSRIEGSEPADTGTGRSNTGPASGGALGGSGPAVR